MRIAFFLLVLANLLFFVWGGGYFGAQEEGREPQRLQNQLHPEKMKVTLAPPAAAPPQACRRIERLAAKDAEALQQALQGAGLTAVLLPMDEQTYWVNIPALASKAAADKKLAELKLLGITDFHVMPGEGGSFVISLGVFRDQAGATQLLQGLAQKGVKSARLDTRTTPAATVRLEVRGGADLIAKRLPELLAATPAATAVECP
ncbi:MAG: SPOR domain-containing protein [Rhodocyclaceae bacterium]|nr:SPOR domain-containing protein [Rhodocyclaceae bacterium]